MTWPDSAAPSSPAPAPAPAPAPPATAPPATGSVALPPAAGPAGPHWALVLFSLALLAAAGTVIWQLVGLPGLQVGRVGPPALVVAGLVLVAAGQLGLLRRRRRARSRRG